MERSGTEPPASASGLTRRQRKRQRRAIRAQQWADAEDSRQDLAEATAEQRMVQLMAEVDELASLLSRSSLQAAADRLGGLAAARPLLSGVEGGSPPEVAAPALELAEETDEFNLADIHTMLSELDSVATLTEMQQLLRCLRSALPRIGESTSCRSLSGG